MAFDSVLCTLKIVKYKIDDIDVKMFYREDGPLGVKRITWSENQRSLFKSLLMSYFIIKQLKRGTE